MGARTRWCTRCPHPTRSAALGDDRLHEVLDLCLMCKACKSECPLGVDMAKLKSEALSHRHDLHGVPLRSRVFGAIRTLNRLGSATAPLSNRTGFLRGLMERRLGITARRPLPRFERRNLVAWFRRRRPVASGREVTLLADSFTTYTEPAIGRAAVELLERAGYRVTLASGGCCGRSSLSKGLRRRRPPQGDRPGLHCNWRARHVPDRGLRTVLSADAAGRGTGAAPGRPARPRRGRSGPSG